jgi:hypothetical protein
MSQSQWPSETIGKEPRHLIGTQCKAILLQQYWYKGELAETANVAYLMLGDEWISLSIDAGVIFWRERPGPPEEISKELSGDDFSYPIVDIGAPCGLVGRVLTNITSKPIQGGSQVALFFQGGSELVFNNIEDNTSFEINEGPANS